MVSACGKPAQKISGTDNRNAAKFSQSQKVLFISADMLLANLYLDPLEPKTPSLPLSTGTVALPKKPLMIKLLDTATHCKFCRKEYGAGSPVNPQPGRLRYVAQASAPASFGCVPLSFGRSVKTLPILAQRNLRFGPSIAITKSN
jgi:hypothetical protein